jgi:N-acetylneuraminate synthase
MEKMKTFHIGNRLVGTDQPTYIIAEIGINHNGDVALAKRLIDVACHAKVDAVKFQKRHLASLYREDVLNETSKYEQNFQYMIPILKEVDLNDRDLRELKQYSEQKGLEFLCTPFDSLSVDCLSEMEVNAFKIASADLSNLELLQYVADKGNPMLVSTGMSYWKEIETAVKLLKSKMVPFALLHCRSVYPVWPREVNLRMINRLGQFGCPVGYSGHDVGIVVPLVAASMGASIIEKHITLDKTMDGPDHKISLEPFELKRMVRDIRVADEAMGKEKRFLLRGEILNRELFGKSLMANCNVASGTRIARHMIGVKGPGKGLAPNRMDALIGTVIQRDVKKDDYFLDEDIEPTGPFQFTNGLRGRWGLISRFSDLKDMAAYGPKVIEFHLAEKDLQWGNPDNEQYGQELIVHAPEYMGHGLLDLCSTYESVRRESVDLIRQTIALTKKIAPYFCGTPKVVVHPGGMSLNSKLKKEPLERALIRSLEEIRHGHGLELLMENLPPYPWYFGGQWKGNYFMDAEEIRLLCEKTRTNIVFDLSHAALYCNAKGKDLSDFIREVKPFIRHVHFADAYGLDGEGVQIDEGDIDLAAIMHHFEDYQGTWVPEIWRGHLQRGRGFLEALVRLRKYNL